MGVDRASRRLADAIMSCSDAMSIEIVSKHLLYTFGSVGASATHGDGPDGADLRELGASAAGNDAPASSRRDEPAFLERKCLSSALSDVRKAYGLARDSQEARQVGACQAMSCFVFCGSLRPRLADA
jgi:hypothetical protein